MSFRDDITAILDDADHILGPEDLDMRATSVTIITRVWSNGHVGSGTSTDTGGSIGIPPLQLPLRTKVRHVSQREIAGSGGRYEAGDVLVGPIRPSFRDEATGEGGGFTETQIAPMPTRQGLEIIYALSQQTPDASGVFGDYRRIDFRRDRRYRMELVIRRLTTKP